MDGTNGGQPPQAAHGEPAFGDNDSVRPHDAVVERAQDVAADARADAAPVNAAAEQRSNDWQAHWIEPREAAEPREAREVREQTPEPSYGPEPRYNPEPERPDFARAEASAQAVVPSYHPEPEPRPQREPEPPRPERSSEAHDEPRPPPETVN